MVRFMRKSEIRDRLLDVEHSVTINLQLNLVGIYKKESLGLSSQNPTLFLQMGDDMHLWMRFRPLPIFSSGPGTTYYVPQRIQGKASWPSNGSL